MRHIILPYKAYACQVFFHFCVFFGLRMQKFCLKLFFFKNIDKNIDFFKKSCYDFY